MRYLVTARLKPDKAGALAEAIELRTLGAGSVAGGEYLRNMDSARLLRDGSVRWVEVCYCETPLAEERAYWEEYFDLVKVQDAHARDRCRDLSGEDSWACSTCDCTDRLEARLATWGSGFIRILRGARQRDTRRSKTPGVTLADDAQVRPRIVKADRP